MMAAFLLRAALAGLGVALAAAPLGSFVVWRRIAYFGDATAHAAILGVALGLALRAPILIGVLVVALAMALAIPLLAKRGHGMDTLLGVFAHGALALGLVAVSLMPNVRTDLDAILFGDLLALRWGDVALIWLGAAGVTSWVVWRWSDLLTATLDPDLARAGGIDADRLTLGLTTALAVVIAVALQVVGALLITALLILPPAAARPLSRAPEQMAALATLIGAISALGGLWLSFLADTPTGPTIVSLAAVIFLGTNLAGALRRV